MRKLCFLVCIILVKGSALAQNVGIGTSNPTAKLDVNGTLKVADGTQGEGRILTSDSSGMASWQPPTSSPTSNNYPAVSICCQTWMTQNLNVDTYRNGDPIPKVTDNVEWAAMTIGAYCYYDNDSATYAATYGKLYNWYALNDPRGLAPAGWHIPSDFEWTTLANCLGGDGVAGGPLKEKGTAHWMTPNTGATNLTNFTAVPGGYRNSEGNFTEIGFSGIWMSSAEINSDNTWSRFMFFVQDDLDRDPSAKIYGAAVRCLKD